MYADVPVGEKAAVGVIFISCAVAVALTPLFGFLPIFSWCLAIAMLGTTAKVLNTLASLRRQCED